MATKKVDTTKKKTSAAEELLKASKPKAGRPAARIPRKTVSVSMKETLYTEIKSEAEAQGLSVNKLINTILRDHFF